MVSAAELARLLEALVEETGIYTPSDILEEFDRAIHEELDFANTTGVDIGTYGGAWRFVTATGTYSTTATAAASGDWIGQIATFKHK